MFKGENIGFGRKFWIGVKILGWGKKNKTKNIV